MKKRGVVLLLLLLVLAVAWAGVFLMKEKSANATISTVQGLFDLGAETKASILIDAKTGKVLYERDADTSYSVASMSKMMTEYLLLEALKEKKVRLTDQVKVSKNAAEAEGARVELKAGRTYPLQDLYYAMAVGSANNATVAIGEYLAGSTTEFAQKMNKKAAELKLTSARFVNATGLVYTYGENKMSARDTAELARRLLLDYPEILNLTAQPSVVLQSTGEQVANTNAMMSTNKPSLQVTGMDGLKTGFTDQAGYCFTGTAKQDGKRLISVVMGTSSDEKRFSVTKKLFDRGFKKS